MQPSEPDWKHYQPGRRVVSLIDWAEHFAPLYAPGLLKQGDLSPPAKGEICTIERVTLGTIKGNLILFLVEHPAVCVTWIDGGTARRSILGFEAQYFRPLDESRLDQFRAMLAGKPADAPREAAPA